MPEVLTRVTFTVPASGVVLREGDSKAKVKAKVSPAYKRVVRLQRRAKGSWVTVDDGSPARRGPGSR